MNRRIAPALVASMVLALSGTAQAGDGRSGRDHYGHGAHYDRYARHHGRDHHRHGHDHFGRGLAIVAGAVILGSIIHAASQDNARRGAEYRRDNRPEAPLPDYWYRIDGDGQCVEVRLNRQGREVWTYVDQSYCN